MATKPFDPTKPVQTRSGLAARVVATDMGGSYPVVALVTINDVGHESPETFTSDGHVWEGDNDRPDDLINIPDQKIVYTPIRATPGGRILASSNVGGPYLDVDGAAAVTMDAVLKVIIEDGQVAAAEIVYRKVLDA